MKISWGTAIIIVIIGFISFILYFFVRGIYEQKVNLVVDDYYEQGLLQNEKANWKENAILLEEDIEISKTQKDVVIKWPNALSNEGTTGTILFYRPNDSKFDVKSEISIIGGEQRISSDKFLHGSYTLKIKALNNGVIYYWDKDFNF